MNQGAIFKFLSRYQLPFATLVDTPKGQAGRPSKSLTLEPSAALLKAPAQVHSPPELQAGLKDRRLPLDLMNVYIVLSLTMGLRAGESRALRRDQADLKGSPDTQPSIPPQVSV